ncbi:MAG: hypothetical protein LBC56_04315 [Oscillospiraceae bacterium]|nr:hypothetical protein [Oscillospiraceae bacterium]
MSPKKNSLWFKLDNAAKVFPPTCDDADPKVFRFACELYEDIEQEILQKALDKTVAYFPGYLVVLKHGLFWYYMEPTGRRPVAVRESKEVCSPIYDKNTAGLLFEVSFYKNRINLEIFHALSDGTGALAFLKMLVCNYIAGRYKDEFAQIPPYSGDGASDSEKMADSFQKYYNPKEKQNIIDKFACRVKGHRLPGNRVKVIGGLIPVDKTLELARKFKTSVTVFLTAVLICSIHETMSIKEEKKPVNICIPVNLRNFFASETMRNFFGAFNVSYNFSKSPKDLESVTAAVAESFQKNLTAEMLAHRMNSLAAMEHNLLVRALPLVIKDPFVRLGYYYSERSTTGTLSNVGRVDLPDEYAKYIRIFDVMSSTKKIQACVCSFRNNMTVNFLDHFVSTDIQKHFFRTLAKMGLPVEITANQFDGWK